MRAGVCCHRGLSAASVSSSGARNGVHVENVHAEVRTRDAFGGAGRSGHEAAVRRQRSGRLEAIGAFHCRDGIVLAFGGGEVGARLVSPFGLIQMARKVAASMSRLARTG